MKLDFFFNMVNELGKKCVPDRLVLVRVGSGFFLVFSPPLNIDPSPQKYTAATIIQATARGRAVRVWKAQFIDKLAIELAQIYRMRYLKRDSADWSWWFDALILENAASPKCAMAWIKLAEQRRYGHHF